MNKPLSQFSSPVPLSIAHDVTEFQSGEATLDDWLKKRALTNMAIGASRSYVLCAQDSHRVIGYYALCMGQIHNKDTTGSMRRNMPTHIPVVVLARLAVDQAYQGQGLGEALLFDAVERVQRAAQDIACRLLITHALSPKAASFYQRYGFVRLPIDSSPTYALDLLKYAQTATD